MQFLIIGDPIAKLKPKTDTSLSFMREALSRGYEVHWCTSEDLFLWENRLWVRVEKAVSCESGQYPQTETVEEPQIVNSYDSVWIRKDPPFDQSYLSLCWLLALEENNVPMINKPSVLLRYHEKLLPFEALDRGYLTEEEIIPTFLPTGRRMHVPENFPRVECVTKPWLGFGGQDVKKIPSPQTQEPYTILQPLQKNIATMGDRRAFFIDGVCVGSFVRLPPPGEVKSNIASGGTGVLREPTKREKDIIHRLENFLKDIGVAFAGVDILDEKVSEINITSPTGFETYYSLGGPRLSPQLLNYIETLA